MEERALVEVFLLRLKAKKIKNKNSIFRNHEPRLRTHNKQTTSKINPCYRKRN